MHFGLWDCTEMVESTMKTRRIRATATVPYRPLDVICLSKLCRRPWFALFIHRRYSHQSQTYTLLLHDQAPLKVSKEGQG